MTPQDSRLHCTAVPPLPREVWLVLSQEYMQVEYATDIIFKQQNYLQTMYVALARTAAHTVKPEISQRFSKKTVWGLSGRYNVKYFSLDTIKRYFVSLFKISRKYIHCSAEVQKNIYPYRVIAKPDWDTTAKIRPLVVSYRVFINTIIRVFNDAA